MHTNAKNLIFRYGDKHRFLSVTGYFHYGVYYGVKE